MASGMNRILHYSFSAVLVCIIACILFCCHFTGHPYHYGWPAYWYSNSVASAKSLGGTFTILATGEPVVVSDDFQMIPLHERGALYFASHFAWATATCLLLFSSWQVLTRWIPPLLRRAPKYSLKSLMIAMTLVAVTIVLMQVRPLEADFKRAEALRQEYPTVYVGLDPTSTWSPWYHRVLIIFGVVSSLVVVGHGLATAVGWVRKPAMLRALRSRQALGSDDGEMQSIG